MGIGQEVSDTSLDDLQSFVFLTWSQIEASLSCKVGRPRPEMYEYLYCSQDETEFCKNRNFIDYPFQDLTAMLIKYFIALWFILRNQKKPPPDTYYGS